ncbi:hypothetical protein PFAG_03088 [Plasmodium falciparum Santa Lucia]|uniref:Uncharacterized protein n=6 Tax=Plasmodium falciparum TaxID=5833 RepID=A0A024W5D5_PLAFA|nr:hypothetical protein PFTANZ_03153 [Plasmodium falciparum Tanzania (2000708)]ETW42385.1 hypothetical protein PFNF135_03241 [Plasmodium falciparum NF135/5.C10]ETW48866.1 hypothetical protein PFMALIP_03088 [Plasmodium falciparum MaliPS096_E11]ETW61045.1 hypothetical protein PFMC_03076 [Plasmodium falciparum CAMP/Malaysia]EUR70940.1 hypothetical protein PFBG_03169 [Plasmodium falciparum 7G8]EUT84794.1 hypothetical protein PFAG_03088 [Plasmodium falciparum Santa Lucia]
MQNYFFSLSFSLYFILKLILHDLIKQNKNTYFKITMNQLKFLYITKFIGYINLYLIKNIK